MSTGELSQQLRSGNNHTISQCFTKYIFFPVGGKIESIKVFPEDLFLYFSSESLDSKQVVGRIIQKDESLYLGDKTGKIQPITYAEIVLQVTISKDES